MIVTVIIELIIICAIIMFVPKTLWIIYTLLGLIWLMRIIMGGTFTKIIMLHELRGFESVWLILIGIWVSFDIILCWIMISPEVLFEEVEQELRQKINDINKDNLKISNT